MRTLHTAALIALVAVASTACDTAAPVAPSDAEAAPPPSQPVMNFTNGPANPGHSHVMRMEGSYASVGIDPNRNRLSVNGLGVADPGLSIYCGGEAIPDVMSIQDIFWNDDRMLGTLKATDVTQHVWAFDGTRTVIDVVCNDEPLAVGRGNFRLQDNRGPEDGTRGWNAQGKLTDPVTGQLVKYSENQRVVIKDLQEHWTTEDIHLVWVGNGR